MKIWIVYPKRGFGVDAIYDNIHAAMAHINENPSWYYVSENEILTTFVKED